MSLNLVAGGSGIISKTEKAVDKTVESTAVEEVELIIAEANMSYYLDDTVTNETLAEYLVRKFSPCQTGSRAEVTFNENGSITYEGANGAVISLEMDESGKVEVTARAGGSKIEKTVTYNANGGTGSVPEAQTFERKATVNVDFSAIPTRENYTFLGWATTSNARSAQYTENGTKQFTMGTSNITLYAVWKARSGIAKSIIQASNYGDNVNYTANGVSDWKVFLNDGNNVYLIAGDYVPNSGLNKATNIENGTGNYTVKATDSRKTLIDWLTKESYWNEYAKGFSGATATGGPTVEQWVQSWNSNSGYEQLHAATTETAMDDGLTGYYVGNSANPTSTWYQVSNSNSLYFPHTSSWNSCSAYWLASPSTTYANGVMYVGYHGDVSGNNYYYMNCGVRPLVKLLGTAKMTWNGSQWNLEN